jgi:alcohol dehydrogenase class IV
VVPSLSRPFSILAFYVEVRVTNIIDPFWIRMPWILTGSGTAAQTGEVARSLGAKKVMIVTDAGVVRAGLLAPVKESLEKAGIEYGVFEEAKPNAPVASIKRCADTAREGRYNLLIAVGGGSVIDTTKLAAVAALGTDTEFDIGQYALKGTPRKGLPKILIPTTAGTGSEASAAAVFTDTEGLVKGTRGEYIVGEVAIVDPELTQNLPPRLTAETGFDAFCHAFEAYTGRRANLVSEALDEMALRLIGENLRPVYFEGGKNPAARYNMAVAATFAMASVSMSQAGLPHAMGHVIQDVVNTSHSNSLSVLLPQIMVFNRDACPEKLARTAALLGENVAGLTPAAAACKAIEGVTGLINDLKLPARMRDIGVGKSQIPRLVDLLFTVMVRNVGNNPRPVTREDAIKIFEAAW